MRTPPDRSAPTTLSPRMQEQTITRRYRLATPLFGGGVSASENDLSMLIRGTSVRGQLRFWWRACFGGSTHATHTARLTDMYRRESALWGSAASPTGGNPSRVQIHVEVTNQGSVFRATNRGMDVRVSAMNSPYGYAAFPLQDKPAATVREGVEFSLTLTFPQTLPGADDRAILHEIEATLWAWETFGGIGARTRRGFGVIQRSDGESAYSFKSERELCAHLGRIIAAGTQWPDKVPHLHPQMALRLVRPQGDALATWAALLRRYKDFRQQRNPGQQPGRPGRSRWPEPDALRRRLRRGSPLHLEPITEVDAFPRAAFGLPIIFHFKDRDEPNATLRPKNHDRFASPLILKPVMAGQRAFGLLAVLANSSLQGEPVIIDRQPRDAVAVDLTSDQAATLTRSDRRTPLLRDQAHPTDVFAALLAEYSAEECV